MSLRPEAIQPVPEQTALVAKSAFPKGSLARSYCPRAHSTKPYSSRAPTSPQKKGKPSIASGRAWKVRSLKEFAAVEYDVRVIMACLRRTSSIWQRRRR
jgi:hypothetical protein